MSVNFIGLDISIVRIINSSISSIPLSTFSILLDLGFEENTSGSPELARSYQLTYHLGKVAWFGPEEDGTSLCAVPPTQGTRVTSHQHILLSHLRSQCFLKIFPNTSAYQSYINQVIVHWSHLDSIHKLIWISKFSILGKNSSSV